MRIVLIGANGNVGTETAMRLAARHDVDFAPIIRTRSGSQYLRYKGVACIHGDVADPVQGEKLLADADVVASLALPAGDPAHARAANRQIIDAFTRFAPQKAALVFFSTLATHGEYDLASGRFEVRQYGRSKKDAERHFLKRARDLGKLGYAIRLGHVLGDDQPLSHLLQAEIATGLVTLVDPERASNVVHTAMIAELLRRLGEGHRPPSGVYDLVNNPNWTWREVIGFEASLTPDRPKPGIRAVGQKTRRKPQFIRSMIAAALRNGFVVRNAPRVLELLPPRFEETARVHYLRQLVARSVAGRENSTTLNPAFYWPALGQNMFPGLDETATLLPAWPMLQDASAWPPDLSI